MAVDAINEYVLECIRRRRIKSGLKVAEAARLTGIPLGSYSCLETGRYRISLENLFRILTVLETDITKVWPSGGKRSVEAVTDSYIRRVVDEARQNIPSLISYEDILNVVCRSYGVSREELPSPSRRRDLAEARTVATILVREQRHLTLVGFADILARDVSSLGHCLRRSEDRLQHDQGLAQRILEAKRMLEEIPGCSQDDRRYGIK